MAKAEKPKGARAKPPAEGSTTWRAIAQNGRLRSTSAAARERRFSRFARWAAIGLGILVLGAGLGYALYFSGSHLEVFDPRAEPVPITRIDFASDGVLDRAWMERTFPLDGRTPAMAFDVHALKERLERLGQVREATVAIILPDVLQVRVREREPLLRARVQTPGGHIRNVLVAADGVVFEGAGYPAETLRRLPGLTGVRFQLEGDRFLPIAAMPTVAPLLEEARREFPELYRTWQWISLADLRDDPGAPHALITVKSLEADRILFAPRVFHRQLVKLSEVLALVREQGLGGFHRIDLSFSEQAIVQIRES
jgi:hypothetical protein